AVKIRYGDFSTVNRQCKVGYTSHDPSLIAVALDLLSQAYDRRQRVRLVGVRFSNLVFGDHQIHLFEDAGKLIDLHQAMDKIRATYGLKAIHRAASFY
ncbi:MAG: DNA polymerase IV, partial [Bacteroidota bacterium]